MGYYKILTGTHRSKGKIFKTGDTIELSDERAARFDPGRLSFVSDTEPKKPKYDFEHWSVQDVESLIDSLDTEEELEQVEKAERSGKNRVSVIRAVQKKLAELS